MGWGAYAVIYSGRGGQVAEGEVLEDTAEPGCRPAMRWATAYGLDRDRPWAPPARAFFSTKVGLVLVHDNGSVSVFF